MDASQTNAVGGDSRCRREAFQNMNENAPGVVEYLALYSDSNYGLGLGLGQDESESLSSFTPGQTLHHVEAL